MKSGDILGRLLSVLLGGVAASSFGTDLPSPADEAVRPIQYHNRPCVAAGETRVVPIRMHAVFSRSAAPLPAASDDIELKDLPKDPWRGEDAVVSMTIPNFPRSVPTAGSTRKKKTSSPLLKGAELLAEDSERESPVEQMRKAIVGKGLFSEDDDADANWLSQYVRAATEKSRESRLNPRGGQETAYDYGFGQLEVPLDSGTRWGVGGEAGRIGGYSGVPLSFGSFMSGAPETPSRTFTLPKKLVEPLAEPAKSPAVPWATPLLKDNGLP